MKGMKIIEAKQERANIYNDIKAILDAHEKTKMDVTVKASLEKLEAKFDALNLDIVNGEKNLERERIIGEQQEKIENRDKGLDSKGKEIKNAFQNYLRDPNAQTLSVYNALQQDNPEQAGYLVAPTEMMSGIIEDKNNACFMRQISKVLPPLSGAQELGVIKRTARISTFAWGTEISAPTADSSLAFGLRKFKPNPATGGILVSKTLIRNAAINAEAYIRGEMLYNQMTNEEQAFMTGDGAGKPLGVFTNSVDGITTTQDISTGNTATEVKIDGLYGAKYFLKPGYWGAAKWLFNTIGVKQLAMLKNSDGQYIWQPSVVANVPDILLGFPVTMSEYAPSTFTTGQYVGLLGDFKSGYWIVDSLNLTIQALLELYALTNQIYFIGRHEVDGAVALEEAFVRIKLA